MKHFIPLTVTTFLKTTGLKTVSLAGSCLLRAWMDTLDSKVIYHDTVVDAAFQTDGQKRIYIFWHENLVWPLYYRKNCNISMLLSQHRDADVLEQVARIFGFGCVRGSTNRGGRAALREMMSAAQQQHLTITPDGPQGPRRTLAGGAIYLASKLQMPIVLLGIGFDRPWRLNSWDRFAVPRPFSRARVISSQDIWIPDNLCRDELEFHRQSVENRLTSLSDEAESWAVSGKTRTGQLPVLPGPKSSVLYRF